VDGVAHRSTQIWQQNSVNGAHDRAATVAAVLKGDSRIAFEAAIEDAQTDPNAAALIPLTAGHVKESLCAVTNILFSLSRVGNIETVDKQIHEEAVGPLSQDDVDSVVPHQQLSSVLSGWRCQFEIHRCGTCRTTRFLIARFLEKGNGLEGLCGLSA
jgi:hypothetical protein